MILASRNQHKIEEFRRLLPDVELSSLPEHVVLPPEVGATFQDNALLKAHAVVDKLGLPAIADDSGIEADDLGGGPGIYSARYAGDNATDQQNLAKFVASVRPGTGLRYVCALVFVHPSGVEKAFTGYCHGKMAQSASGQQGFGYDPIFLVDNFPAKGKSFTMAELSNPEKDAISHRGNAARQFLQWLSEDDHNEFVH